MKVIDLHAHIYPQSIGKKASAAIRSFYNMPVRFNGTVPVLLEISEKAKVDIFVVHSVATDPKQVESINDFIAQTVNANPGKFIGFATIHPNYKHVEKEIERVISLGLKGIKIHPDFQKFNIDSKAAFGIYEAVEGRLPVLVHTGDYRYGYSKAGRIITVLDKFRKLEVICAHFGGWSEWEDACAVLAGRNIKVDTSSSLYAMTKEQVRKLINGYGIDNVLFGSDYPMWDPAGELELLKKIGLTNEELEKVLHLNAERLLGL